LALPNAAELQQGQKAPFSHKIQFQSNNLLLAGQQPAID